MIVICRYCLKRPELVDGTIVYPHRPDLADKRFWYCKPCQAWVGCHQGTDNPLGLLANAELRQARMEAHAAFDPIWQGDEMSRKQAYAWLACQLGIPVKDCHMSWLDLELLKQVPEICERRYRDVDNARVR